MQTRVDGRHTTTTAPYPPRCFSVSPSLSRGPLPRGRCLRLATARSLSLSHTHIHTLTLSLSLSLSPCPWRFSRESGRGAASRAREMPVIRRDFNYAHYESFSPRETRGTVLDARSSALRDKGGPASRRSAPRVRSDALFYEHDRPLPLLLYSRHAVTLACTTSAATIAVPLFSHLFSLIVPYFFVVIGIIGGRSFYITYHRYYQLSPRDRFYFFLLSLRLAINETFRRAKLGNFRRVHFEDTMIRVVNGGTASRLTRLLCRFVSFADHFSPFPWVIEGQRRARLSA